MSATMPKLVLPGGSGFLGRMLARWFDERGWEVVVLTRRSADVTHPARAVSWDGATLGGWQSELEGATAVVNLAGRSVNCRYHASNRRTILESRVHSTRVLGEAIRLCAHPPRVWLNSSTATIYQHSFKKPMDEASGIIAGTPVANDVFSVEVAQAWERALAEAIVPHTRKVDLRSAIVFGVEQGGVYRVLRRLARCGLGGAMGGGAQYVSWIHEADFCRAIDWLIAHDDVAGPVNLAAPHPLPNRDVMRLVRQASGVPFGLPASRWMLEIGAVLLGTETELILKSRRVVPGRLIGAGFEFEFPRLVAALADLEGRLAAGKSAIAGMTGSSDHLQASRAPHLRQSPRFAGNDLRSWRIVVPPCRRIAMSTVTNLAVTKSTVAKHTVAKHLRRDPADVAPWAETCGQIRPLVEEKDGAAAEIHHVQIDHAKLHFHAQTDEFYYIIDGQGTMILDDDQIEVHQGVVVYVPRGVKHKAVGKLTILTICIPPGVLHDIHELE